MNVVAALKDKLGTLPPNAVVGLWTFDGVEGRSEVPTGPLSDQLNGQPRSAALTAVLDKQFASNGGAVSFTTLKMIYDGAVAGYRPGMNNSVLVITAGRTPTIPWTARPFRITCTRRSIPRGLLRST